MTEWIKGIGGFTVTHALRKGTQVWLYRSDEDGLVGFGSLGKSNWEWPGPDEPRVSINIIPALGIKKSLRGKPNGPKEERYSSQILDDLIAEAVTHTERQALLGLFVDPRNEAGIKVYERLGFVRYHHTSTDTDTGVTYHGMILKLAR